MTSPVASSSIAPTSTATTLMPVKGSVPVAVVDVVRAAPAGETELSGAGLVAVLVGVTDGEVDVAGVVVCAVLVDSTVLVGEVVVVGVLVDWVVVAGVVVDCVVDVDEQLDGE